MRPANIAVAWLLLGVALTTSAHAQAPEKRQLTLGVGGKSALYYLPLTIAERLGHFRQQGLDVTINDFRGGAQSLQALVGGSADVVTGAYEHTIRMQAKGQDVKAVIELGRFPGIVLGVRKDHAASYRSYADLKGMKIGVSAPGSSTNFFVMYLMAKAGLKPTDASYIGVGIGPSAVAAITKGEIDALSNLDPMMTKLEQDGNIKIIADTRTEEGTRAIFGGSNPAAVLLQHAEMARPGDAGTDRCHRPGGLLSRRQGTLCRRGQGQQAGLFPDRHDSRRGDEICVRHAGRL